jgi:hydroxypyruvate isomerase
MQRRDFVRTTFAGAAAAAAAGLPLGAAARRAHALGAPAAPAFTMKFAPHFGQFASAVGDDPVAELRVMYDAGFRAVEDNLMRLRPVEVQERIGREARRLGMEFGLISAMRRPNTPPNHRRPQLGSDKPEERAGLVGDVRDTVPVAKRCGARFVLVTPGQLDPGVEPAYQMAAAVETLRALVKEVEPHGLTLLVEPLNPWANHAGAFVTKSSQLYALVRAVGSPAFRMLFDLYHLQIAEGNLMANFDRCQDAIGYVQCGDVPGRKEPGTGEINYARVFDHIARRGYRGVVGTEHETSLAGAAGEQALVAAYRRVDPAPGAFGARGASAGSPDA